MEVIFHHQQRIILILEEAPQLPYLQYDVTKSQASFVSGTSATHSRHAHLLHDLLVHGIAILLVRLVL